VAIDSSNDTREALAVVEIALPPGPQLYGEVCCARVGGSGYTRSAPMSAVPTAESWGSERVVTVGWRVAR
jgi:hypothetical protein